MTVGELIEKLSKCSPDMLVVTEDGESGFDHDWSAVELNASVRRVASKVYVDYVRKAYTPPERIERIVALTSWGHHDDQAVEL
jgi:hypothetical protein